MMRAALTLGIALALVVSVAHSAGAADPPADPWQPILRLVGQWKGTASGEAGQGEVNREYTRVLKDRYVRETNTSVYPAQERNKTGETHEHWSMFSYDKQRKLLVLRQFHVEGFVNTFRFSPEASTADRFVFDSESFENFSNAWKARETYEFTSLDEFVETFELAPPGKPYQVYSRTQLKRVAP